MLTIGQAAARCGVPPSTLRWWEKRGLLAPSGRSSGQRRYSTADLERIAMIRLWQNTGLLGLDDIAALLVDEETAENWRDTLRGRIAEIDREQRRLAAARAYLEHALSCPRDHPVDQCPYLRADADRFLT